MKSAPEIFLNQPMNSRKSHEIYRKSPSGSRTFGAGIQNCLKSLCKWCDTKYRESIFFLSKSRGNGRLIRLYAFERDSRLFLLSFKFYVYSRICKTNINKVIYNWANNFFLMVYIIFTPSARNIVFTVTFCLQINEYFTHISIYQKIAMQF